MVTAVTYNGGTGSSSYAVTGQVYQGGSACTITSRLSKVGLPLRTRGLPQLDCYPPRRRSYCAATEAVGASLYVTEIYYTYNAVTPVPAFLGNILPSQLYSAAYY